MRSLKGFYFLELSKSFFKPRVLTRLGRICLHPSQVTVGEKAWEAVSFPGGEFFRQNMRSGQKVGQQVLLWAAHVRKSVGSIKSRQKLCKKGTIGISSKVSQHALIARDQSCRLSGFGWMVPNGSAKSGPKNGPNLTKASKKAAAVFCHHSG